nr:siphovirus ReqiPepy6 Gp37-like family protein [Anaerofustis sp. NSJ-163]
MDFTITISPIDYDENIKYGNIIFIPNSEYAGIIGGIETNTSDNTVIIKGYCLRGILNKRIIVPPKNQAYKQVSGEINSIIKSLIDEEGIGSFFSVSEVDTGININNFKFDRYCTLLNGIEKMLKSVNYKLSIKYIQGQKGEKGYALLSSTPIIDYSDTLELSQDNLLDFIFKESNNGVNHLICLGKGELTDRVVIDLYVGKNGEITENKFYKGLEEITQVYEDTNSESDELRERGIEKLNEIKNTKTFSMDINTLNIDIEIGDIIGGRDYITGNSLKSPVVNKIYTVDNGKESKEYKIEGDD